MEDVDGLLSTDKDATPIEPEDLQHLIPHLTTRSELNRWEAANIENGAAGARRSRIFKRDILSITGILAIHKRMFDQTWRWGRLIDRVRCGQPEALKAIRCLVWVMCSEQRGF